MKAKYLKKALMCRPTYYSVDYAINPWMRPGSTNPKVALRQWESLVEKLLNLGVNIEFINQEKGLPDMVFSADQGAVKKNKVLMSNFRYGVRQGEREPYLDWFIKRNYQPTFLPQNYFFEGGDILPFKNIVFVGTGFRTSEVSCKKIGLILDVEVIKLQLINPRFYHLDMCLLPLDTRTAFFYPEAFSQESLEKLARIIPCLVPLSKKETYGFSANSIVTDHHVVLQKNNPFFKEKLLDFGYYPVEADLGEFMKSGGGIHCLIEVLSEEYQ